MGMFIPTGVVFAITEALRYQVVTIIQQEVDIVVDFPRQIESLQDEFRRMQCFLKDSEVDQARVYISADWVEQVKKLAYHAEDLIEGYLLQRESNPKTTGTTAAAAGLQFKKLVCHQYKLWRYKHKITRDILALKEKLQKVNQHSSPPNATLSLSSAGTPLQHHQMMPSFSAEENMPLVGLEDEAAKLVRELLRDNKGGGGGGGRRSVISVVGMGGIGKSSLAWKVYNLLDVQTSFRLRAWVSVTRRLNYEEVLIRILSSLLSRVDEQELRGRRTEWLEEMFNQTLSKDRYLVVLDDVWGPPHYPPWDRLLEAFPDVRNGSRVMITTRMTEVALHADPHNPPFKMHHLGEEESWELFCIKAGIGTNDIEFRDIGRKVVGRCGGLPQSIVAMGSKFGTLTRRRTDWEHAYKTLEKSPIKLLLEQVARTLEPSYNNLTPELKYCFLRLGYFPENYTIPTRKLTQLWLAEGLITEQEGESHLDALAERNMIEPMRISPDGRIKTCRIDNSLRELSISKAKEEILLEIQDSADSEPSSQCRHRAIYNNADRYFDSQHSTSSHLRSLVFFVPGGTISFGQLEFICKRFKLLKVLHLEGMALEILPDEVGQLRNLRYLNLRNTRIYQLCPSMSSLNKLLTLDIRDNMYLRDLKVIEGMTSLQNLYLPGFYEELKLQTLSELHTLKRAKVSGPELLECLAKLAGLRTLQVQLEGLLNLDSFLNSLTELEYLESLHLYPNIEISSLETSKFRGLASLTKLYIKGGVRKLPGQEDFPPNLMQLTLDGSGIIPFPMETLGNLPKLSILRLRNLYVKGEKLSFSKDRFPRLKYLELVHLWNLKCLELRGRGALSTLQHLKISHCTALNGLPTEMEHLAFLSELHIDRMSEKFVEKFREEVQQRLQHVCSKFTNTLKYRD